MKKFLIFSVLCLVSQIAFSQIAKIAYSFANNNQCAIPGGTFATINLTDQSTSGGTREWTILGDVTPYTASPLSYNFTSPGTYKIILTVTYAGSVQRKDSISVVIYPMPVFTIVKGNDSICPGGSIPFSYILSPQTTSTITRSLWNFDNDTSTSANPVRRFDNPQNKETPYDVSLTLTDNNGCAAKVDSFKFVHVRSKPEVAFVTDLSYFCFIAPPIAATPAFTNYTDTAAKRSFSQNTYLWKFDDGNTATQYSPAKTINHTYQGAGVYRPKLIAIDQYGCSDSVSVRDTRLIRLNQLNLNYTVSDTLVCALPDTVRFKGNDWSLTYRWRIGTLSGHGDKTGSEVYIPFRKTDVGHHLVRVTITDDSDINNPCSATDTFRIRVYDKTPSAILAKDTNECDPDHVIHFENATVYPWADDYGEAMTNWYFGDQKSDFNKHSTVHTYGTSAISDYGMTDGGYGNYRVMMTGRTPYGCPMDTAYQWIHIFKMHAVGIVSDPEPPNPPHGCAPHTVELTHLMDSLISSSEITDIIWRWDYGGQWNVNDTFATSVPFVLDGSGNQIQNHTYQDTGIYRVYFTLINEQGCVHDVDITTIKVGNPPLVDFFFIEDTACKSNIQIRAFAYDSVDASGNLVAGAWANEWAWNDDNDFPVGTPNDTSVISPNEVGSAAVTLVASHNGCPSEYQPRKEGMGLVCPPIAIISKPKDDDRNPGPPIYCSFDEVAEDTPFEQGSMDMGAIYLKWYKGDSDILEDTAKQSRSPLMVYDSLTQTYSWDSTGWIKDTIVTVVKKGQTIQEKRGLYRPGIITATGEDGNYGFVYDTGSYLRANRGLVVITLWAMNDSSLTDDPENEPWFNKCGYCEHSATQKIYISYAKMNFTVSQPTICQRDSVVFFDSTECNVDIFGWGFKFIDAAVPARSDFTLGEMIPIKNYTPWPKAGKGSTVKFRNTNSYKVVLIDTCGFGCIRMDTLAFDVHPQSIPAFVSSTDSILFNGKKDTICANNGGYLYLQDKSYSLSPFQNTKITDWEWKVGPETSTEQDPTLQSVFAGLHDLSLKITNEHGCTSDSLFYDQVLINNIYVNFRNPGDGRGGSICNKEKVAFINSSQVLHVDYNHSTYLKYEWDWGDGDTSVHFGYSGRLSDGSGSHIYNLPNATNKVVVKLKVTIVDPTSPHAPKGCSAEYEDTIIVTRPIADFTTEQHIFACPQDEQGIVGRTITFKDQSHGDTEITVLKWNFGDTASINNEAGPGSPNDNRYKNPSHTYLGAGKYNVLLIAQDENNCSDSMLLMAYIDIAGPQGSVSYSPTDSCMPLSVVFMYTVPSDLQYKPDSIVVNASGSNKPTMVGSGWFHPNTAVYNKYGNYVPSYTLYKTVKIGDKEEICEVRFLGKDTIFVVEVVINFEIEPLYCPDVPVTFKNTTVVNPSGVPATSTWTFGNGDTLYTYDPTTQFDTPGNYEVLLYVTARNCTKGPRKKTIEVMEFPTVTFTPDTADACDGLIVRFEADSLTDVEKSRIVRYDWTFPDGKTYSRGKDTNWLERDFSVSGDYSYNLTLTFISDSAGCSQVYTGNVKINAFVSPTARFGATPEHGQVGEDFVFDASSSTPGDGSLKQWIWDYGDKSMDSLTTTSATHKYDISGERFVLLTIIDEYGCFDTTSMRITVADQIYFGNVFTPDATCSTGKCVFRPLEAKGTFAEFRMEVYDKWGMRVWRNSCKDNSNQGTCPDYESDDSWWDGTNAQGRPVPAGVYYWVIYTKSSLAEGKPHVLNGSVTIFR